MHTNPRSIALVMVAAALSVAAQVFFKFASQRAALSLAGTLFNVPLLLGFASYAIVALVFVNALKEGELTVLYPLLATSYIGVALVSPLFFDDSLNTMKVAGMLIVIMGVYFIARGMQHKVEVV